MIVNSADSRQLTPKGGTWLQNDCQVTVWPFLSAFVETGRLFEPDTLDLNEKRNLIAE